MQKNMIISDQIKAKWLDYWFGEFKKNMKVSLINKENMSNSFCL